MCMNISQIIFGTLLVLTVVLAACQPVQQPSPQHIAEQWVTLAPTYAFDGQDLVLVDSLVRESYPEQYVFIFEFTSTSAGYGDRSEQMTAQVLTDHTIEVVVVEGQVVSAVIDGVWDELTQTSIVAQDVVMAFAPMQCVEYAWDEWYASGEVQFAAQPSTRELIATYYVHQGVEIGEVLAVEFDGMVCQACEVCPVGITYYVFVSEQDVPALIDDGWVVDQDVSN